jgi:hypothetical protein
MAMDPLEKDRLRQKMATQMGIFLGGAKVVSCVSSHYYGEPQFCELCGQTHTEDIFVIKNRSGKKMRVGSGCLREMVRFQVTDVEDFTKWLSKLSELKVDFERRKAEAEEQRQEERKRLEKKVIVRKRPS